MGGGGKKKKPTNERLNEKKGVFDLMKPSPGTRGGSQAFRFREGCFFQPMSREGTRTCRKRERDARWGRSESLPKTGKGPLPGRREKFHGTDKKKRIWGQGGKKRRLCCFRIGEKKDISDRSCRRRRFKQGSGVGRKKRLNPDPGEGGKSLHPRGRKGDVENETGEEERITLSVGVKEISSDDAERHGGKPRTIGKGGEV